MLLEDRVLLVLQTLDQGGGVDAITVSKVTLLVGFGQHWEDMVLHRSRLGPTSVSVWDAIDELERRNCIERTPDSQSGWGRRYFITPHGIEGAANLEAESPIEASRIINSVNALTANTPPWDMRALTAASQIVYQAHSDDQSLADMVVNTSRLQGWELTQDLLKSTAHLVCTVRPSISARDVEFEEMPRPETAAPSESGTQ